MDAQSFNPMITTAPSTSYLGTNEIQKIIDNMVPHRIVANSKKCEKIPEPSTELNGDSSSVKLKGLYKLWIEYLLFLSKRIEVSVQHSFYHVI